MIRTFKVMCSECSEEHSVDDVEAVNIEEDIQIGRAHV